MIKGILKKPEPLENGEITLMITIPGDPKKPEEMRAKLGILSALYKLPVTILSEQEFAGLPQDRFFLLLDIRTKCQQVQDLITAELEPLPAQIDAAIVDEPLTAADEFDRKDHIEFSKGIPENDFYGEDVG